MIVERGNMKINMNNAFKKRRNRRPRYGANLNQNNGK